MDLHDTVAAVIVAKGVRSLERLPIWCSFRDATVRVVRVGGAGENLAGAEKLAKLRQPRGRWKSGKGAAAELELFLQQSSSGVPLEVDRLTSCHRHREREPHRAGRSPVAHGHGGCARRTVSKLRTLHCVGTGLRGSEKAALSSWAAAIVAVDSELSRSAAGIHLTFALASGIVIGVEGITAGIRSVIRIEILSIGHSGRRGISCVKPSHPDYGGPTPRCPVGMERNQGEISRGPPFFATQVPFGNLGAQCPHGTLNFPLARSLIRYTQGYYGRELLQRQLEVEKLFVGGGFVKAVDVDRGAVLEGGLEIEEAAGGLTRRQICAEMSGLRFPMRPADFFSPSGFSACRSDR